MIIHCLLLSHPIARLYSLFNNGRPALMMMMKLRAWLFQNNLINPTHKLTKKITCIHLKLWYLKHVRMWILMCTHIISLLTYFCFEKRRVFVCVCKQERFLHTHCLNQRQLNSMQFTIWRLKLLLLYFYFYTVKQ